MDQQDDVVAGQIVRIGDVDYLLTPLQPSDVSQPDGEALGPTETATSDLSQQQLQVQQEMLALMTGEGINVNVKNLDTQARFGS